MELYDPLDWKNGKQELKVLVWRPTITAALFTIVKMVTMVIITRVTINRCVDEQNGGILFRLKKE